MDVQKSTSQIGMTEACQAFLKCLEIDPDCLFAANGLGIIAMECGMVDDGEKIFQKVRDGAHETTPPSFHKNLGNIYFLSNKLKEALQSYTKALKFIHSFSLFI